MQLIIVRGAAGIAAWTKALLTAHTWSWVCSRDQFAVAGPTETTQAEAAAVAIVQHSATLVGAVSQVLELDL